jgi:predicted nucleic acid-binding protein
VARVWVVNASPCIALERIGHLHLLSALADIIVPEGVLTELGRGPKPIGIEAVRPSRVVRVEVIHPTVAAWDLGLGEAEVLSWGASVPDVVAIIDDRAARRCAQVLGVGTCGTLGVVLEAKRAQLVPAATPLVQGLRSAGLFLSDSLVERALRAAGE